MRFALLNQSDVDNATCSLIALAMKMHLDLVCARWERLPIQVEFMAGLSVAPDGWIAMLIAQHPDVAGA